MVCTLRMFTVVCLLKKWREIENYRKTSSRARNIRVIVCTNKDMNRWLFRKREKEREIDGKRGERIVRKQ